MADAIQALAVVRAKLSNFPDHGARDGAAVYKINGAELGLIVDALAAREEGRQSSGERVKALEEALRLLDAIKPPCALGCPDKCNQPYGDACCRVRALLAPQAAPVEQPPVHGVDFNVPAADQKDGAS